MLLLLVAFAAIAAAVAAVSANAGLDAFLRQLLYFPSRDVRATPADAGLRYEETDLVASDGVHIRGWFVGGSSGVTLLWFHGNAGNFGDRVGLIRQMRDATGAAVFIVSYRGYGPSEGRPSEAGLYRDAQAALDYLRSRPDVDARRIVYFGQSIGAAVAVELATREAPLALILEAPFPSLRWFARQVHPWPPIWPLLGGRYDSEEKASRIAAPALVIHGEDDEIAPVSGGRAVAAALGGEVDLAIIPGAGHNDLPLVAGQEYYERVAAFLARVDRARWTPRLDDPCDPDRHRTCARGSRYLTWYRGVSITERCPLVPSTVCGAAARRTEAATIWSWRSGRGACSPRASSVDSGQQPADYAMSDK